MIDRDLSVCFNSRPSPSYNPVYKRPKIPAILDRQSKTEVWNETDVTTETVELAEPADTDNTDTVQKNYEGGLYRGPDGNHTLNIVYQTQPLLMVEDDGGFLRC